MIDLYVPTVMVISFIAIAISLPNTLVRDREIGWLRRLSTTPVHPSRLLAAQLILDLVLAAAAIVIVIVGGTAIFGAPHFGLGLLRGPRFLFADGKQS